jgi:hypothetical protein
MTPAALSRFRSGVPAPPRPLCLIDLRMRMHRDLDEVSYLFQIGVIDVYEVNAWLMELWDRYSAAERDLQDWLEVSGC